jgi:ABC-2 type transport system permease protein/lipopolysaccharide transport system permease protein
MFRDGNRGNFLYKADYFREDQLKYINEIKQYRNVLDQLVRQQITLRYRRTFFGYLWTLFNPLLMMSVTAIVFSAIFKMDLKTYAVFLFSGVIAFNLFGTIVTQCGQSLVGNEQLIKKIYIPKFLFPLAVSITLLIDSLLMFVSLFFIIVIIGGNYSTSLVGLFPAYILLYLFAFGIGLITSIISVYFRDLLHIITILMQALVFLSPVYYKPDNLGVKVQWVMELNPLTQFIELFRSPIFSATFPAIEIYLQATLYAVLSLSAGIWFFNKHEQRVTFRM